MIDMKELKRQAHMKGLRKSMSAIDLKTEASLSQPITMLGLGHVSTIVGEVIEENNLLGSVKTIELGVMNDLISAMDSMKDGMYSGEEIISWLQRQKEIIKNS